MREGQGYPCYQRDMMMMSCFYLPIISDPGNQILSKGIFPVKSNVMQLLSHNLN